MATRNIFLKIYFLSFLKKELQNNLSTVKTSVTGQLASVELNNLLVSSTGNSFFLLGEDNLDVRRRRHERVDSTVSTVSTTTVLRGLVDNNAGNGKFLNI
jgi:hypothetical protein